MGEGSWRSRALFVVALVAAVTLLIWFLWAVVEVFLVAFAGILFAVVLRSLADLLSDHTPISPGWALVIVVLVLPGVTIGGGALLAPQIAEQAAELVVAVPEAIGDVEGWIERQSWSGHLGGDGTDLVGTAVESLRTQGGALFSSTFGTVVELLVVLFLGVYLAASPRKYAEGLILLVPLERRQRAREVLLALGFTLKWFLLARLAAMLVVGVVTTVGLWLLGVPLALVFGLITTLLTFVPYVGPVVSAFLPMLIALTVSPTLVLYTALLYLVVQNLEGYLLTPLLLQGVVSVPPGLTVLAEVTGAILFGVFGIILATPFLTVAMVAVQLLYVEDTLGDELEVKSEDRSQKQLAQERGEAAHP